MAKPISTAITGNADITKNSDLGFQEKINPPARFYIQYKNTEYIYIYIAT